MGPGLGCVPRDPGWWLGQAHLGLPPPLSAPRAGPRLQQVDTEPGWEGTRLGKEGGGSTVAEPVDSRVLHSGHLSTHSSFLGTEKRHRRQQRKAGREGQTGKEGVGWGETPQGSHRW